MENGVGSVVKAVQNPLMDGVSELSIPSDLPVSKEYEGDDVFVEAEEVISNDGAEPAKEDSIQDTVPSVSSDVQGLEYFETPRVLGEQHDDEIMQDAMEEHSSDENSVNGVAIGALNDKVGTENECVLVDEEERGVCEENGTKEVAEAAFIENEAKVVLEPHPVQEKGTSELEVHESVEENPIKIVMAKEKLYDADGEEMSRNGTVAHQERTSDGPVACEFMEEVNRELNGEASADISSADKNHTHKISVDGLSGEKIEMGSADPKDAMPVSDAQDQNGILYVDPLDNTDLHDGTSGMVKHIPAPSLSEEEERSRELKDSDCGLSTSFESGIVASKAETSSSSDVSSITEDKEREITSASNLETTQSKHSKDKARTDSVNNLNSSNSAEVGIKGGEVEPADEGKQCKQVNRELETKSANPVLPLVRPAGLGRAAPLLEPAPRVQQPRYNGAVSQVQHSQLVEEVGNGEAEEGGDETREKLQKIRVKFLRLAHRLGQTPHNVVVAQVLYRLGLAEQLRGRTGGRTGAFSYDRASAIAEQLEQTGMDPLDFSCTIMVLGKTGVGKSATINSLFDEKKFSTDAFDFGTKKVQDVEGTVQGIKVRVIDTPGLLQSWSDQQKNEKILLSVKQFIKKTPPDIILYLDRLDMPSRDSGDMALLRTITDVFGPSIWFNAIVVLTHAASAPPEGPNGVASTYDIFVTQRSQAVQQAIRQAAGDMRLMNPVSLVENHSACRTNRAGQRVLPNGQVWKPHLLLLSFASKILAEANTLLKLQDTPSGNAFAARSRAPPLPFLLSSLLQSRSQLKLPEEQLGEEDDFDDDLDDSPDSDEESEYDELPPFRPLANSQLANLTKEQRKAYDAELEYREKLFMKKQLKEERKRRKLMKKLAEAAKDLPSDVAENVDEESSSAASLPVPMPDLSLPASFDADNPTHRYRYLDTSNQWLIRPVLDAHGWDHDVGYEGINVERLFAVKNKVPVSFSGQVSKDKKESSLQMEVASSIKHGEGKGTTLGLDMQSVGKDMAYTMRSETKFCNYKHNKASAGLSFTLLGDAITAGLKLEDKLVVNNQFKMVMSGGAMTGRGDIAYGGSLEATLRDKDYPLGRFLSTLGVSVMDWHGDLAIGCNIQSQIPVGRSSNLVARANLNNRGSGQVSIRLNSSEQIQLALIGLIPLLKKVMAQYSSQ
ncbi:hypothetical protein V2J09_015532 [Rumex salicifolius]